MNKVIIAAVVVCGLASACTVRTERTVVEKPAQPTTAVVVPSDPPPPPPPPGTVVYTR